MAHIHDLYDFTVSAFIVHADKVLLLHHKKLDTWLQPGGHIELNEDPEMALWREIKEETGLTQDQLVIVESTEKAWLPTASRNVKALPIPFDLNVHPFGNDSTHKHIDLCYLMKSNTIAVDPNKEELNDIRWFNASELNAMKQEILENVYIRAQFALDTVS